MRPRFPFNSPLRSSVMYYKVSLKVSTNPSILLWDPRSKRNSGLGYSRHMSFNSPLRSSGIWVRKPGLLNQARPSILLWDLPEPNRAWFNPTLASFNSPLRSSLTAPMFNDFDIIVSFNSPLRSSIGHVPTAKLLNDLGLLQFSFEILWCRQS